MDKDRSEDSETEHQVVFHSDMDDDFSNLTFTLLMSSVFLMGEMFHVGMT